MILGRVTGEVVASQKHPTHEGRKILVVQPISPDGADLASPTLLALDAVDAGVGDRVLVVQEGFSAMSAAGRKRAPIDMTILAVVDSVDML
jgi:microcompartment protein CcmK/EutM